jgi:enamine deaminase RidA (YjgF/YER057c/UK114 family)
LAIRSYLSGQIGIAPGRQMPEGIEAQARQTMDNIGATLKGQALGWGDVRMHGDARQHGRLAGVQ